MKTRYIFTAIVAALTLLVTGCQKEADHYLNEIKVSSSYISIPVDGGSAQLEITATDSWAFDKVFKVDTGKKDENGKAIMEDAELPAWLSADRLGGVAGESKVVLSADATLDGRVAELRISCAGKTQIVNVIQGLAVVEKATCADIIAGPESKTYMVTGTCVKIVNTTYGNWYIEDGTTDQEIQIYGTLDAKGAEKNFLSLGIEEGDEVTVQGPKSVYNGLVELVNVTVLNISKSLIKVDSTYVGGKKAEVAELPLEGDQNLDVYLTCKGNGVNVTIPEDAKGWLSIDAVKSGDTPIVTFKAARNDGGDRSTTVTFMTVDDKGKEYTSNLAISQKGAILEVSIADFLAAAVGDTQYRITGVITKVANTDYGNVNIRDWSGEAYVYGIGAKGDFVKLGIGEGDIVTLVGKRGEHNGNAQMSGGQFEKSIVTVKGKTLKEIASAADDPAVYYLATGTLKEIAGKDYGNVWLSDDSGELYVYGCYPGWGATGDNRKGAIDALGIKVGDKLSVIGVKGTYNDAPQIANGIYFSHEEGDPGPGPEPQGSITIDGNPADWEGLAGVASATCPADAKLTGIKSAKAYYGDKLYILTEFSDEALAKGVADGKLRFHVFFSGAEGLLSRFWKDENIQYMMEGKATSGGVYAPFSSNLYKFTGATSADWSWESTGITPTMESVGSGNFYELAFDYSDYPGGFPEQIEIGIDCADGDYNVTGYAPQTSHKFCLKKGEVVELPDDPDPQDEEGISVSQMLGLENDATVESKPSLVAAVTARGFIATDGSKSIYVYTKSSGYDTYNGVAQVGDKVKFTGQKTVYGGVHEIQNVSALEVVSSGNAVNYPTAKDVTASAVDYTSEEAEFITFTGTLAVSGNYFNINIDGVDKSVKQGSVVYPVDTDALKAQDGKHLRFTGYFNGLTGSGKYLNIITTSIEEVTAPAEVHITIDGDLSDWDAVEGAGNGTHGMFKVASDDENIYFYTWRTTEGRFSELWGAGAGYIYFAFDLDGNPDNGVSLNSNGPYDYIGFIYCFGGTASEPVIEITKAGDCAPDGYTVDNVVVKGKVDSNGAYVEYSIPRADLPEIPKTPVTVTSWGNKDLSKVQLTATL